MKDIGKSWSEFLELPEDERNELLESYRVSIDGYNTWESYERPDPESPTVTYTFPNTYDYKWEIEAIPRITDFGIVMSEMLLQGSYHKHTTDEDEYDFWNRFSNEVTIMLENHDLMDIVRRLQ